MRRKSTHLLLSFFACEPQNFENLMLQLLVVNTNGTPADFHSVHHEIIRVGTNSTKIGGHEMAVLLLAGSEGMVFRLSPIKTTKAKKSEQIMRHATTRRVCAMHWHCYETDRKAALFVVELHEGEVNNPKRVESLRPQAKEAADVVAELANLFVDIRKHLRIELETETRKRQRDCNHAIHCVPFRGTCRFSCPRKCK